MRLFGELTKIEDQPDGTLKVYGVASTGARDDEGEIVRPAAMKAALPDYARYPALREMHQPTAAGRTLEATVDEDGATRIVAQVVDPVAIAKVKSRTYSGFSIGGRVLARDPADASIITRIKLTEISLVDRPANPEAVIDLWKAAAAAPPSNVAVKAKAAELARAAGRAAAWKDYVAKARQALLDEPPDGPDDAPDPDDDAASLGADPAADQMSAQAPRRSDDPSADEAGDPDDDGDDDLSGDANDSDEADDAADDDRGEYAGSIASAAGQLAALASEDPTVLQAVHDMLTVLGAYCDPSNCPSMGKASYEPDLAKALPRVDALERRLAEQGALIERLAATPQPPRAAANVHAVGKAEDADPAADASPAPAELDRALAALTPDERAFLLMKASLRQPIPL
jgi:phage head maturation protease